MTFLRELLAVILGVFIAMAIMFVVFIAIISASASSFGEDKKVTVKDNSVLELDLVNNIKDYAPKSTDPFADILDLKDGNLGLQEVLNAIENAKTDDKIKGISINSLFINAGISQTKAIRDKLAEFKESGKFVYAWADFYLQKNYYLSSIADSVFINPIGEIDFKGLSSEVMYYKNLQDKTGVKMEVIRQGKYKSAAEPYLDDKMSKANREQIGSFLHGIWDELLIGVGTEREKTEEELNTIADSLWARTPKMAVNHKMIDGELYMDQYDDLLRTKMGLDSLADLEKVTIANYILTGKGRIKSSATDKIGILYAQGEIMDVEGTIDIIGPEKINESLKKLREDDKVKAIVLRINSPGGSALASDKILREVELTKKTKPVVVSMGDVAASGGYYIACKADEIFAQPTTITGSIGVFALVPNFSKLADDIGINAEQVSTNTHAVGYTAFEPMTANFKKVTKEAIGRIYNTFLSHVSEGRNMTIAQVDSIAQGRVWTGKQAMEIGLVDEMGGLQEAVAAAAELANISDYRLVNYPRYKTDFSEVFNPWSFLGTKKDEIIKQQTGEPLFKVYNELKRITGQKGIQARMPYLLEIK
ncbi:MAG: signal peptide peptidase SppA [Flavobacteriales bacterium]|nr:MAG: signal peptide peptidase SppA [Flavobacteriales bacterium]